MHRVYPATAAYYTGFVTTRDGLHQLHVELHGNPKGLPVVCCHGGPGAGTSPLMHRFFDLSRYHVLSFDQRGAGQSLPSGGLQHNTTAHLIDDIAHLTDHFSLKRFALFGGSWGATLALLFAAQYPDRVLGLVLRGVFLCDPDEMDWLYGGGAGALYPGAWTDFLAPLPVDGRGQLSDIVAGYGALLHDGDPLTRMRASRAWNLWETRVSLCDEQAGAQAALEPKKAYAMALIEHHFLSQGCFLQADAVMASVTGCVGLPAWLVHGKRDYVCRASNALRLKTVWPNLQLSMPEAGGHSAFTPGMAEALCEATGSLAARYGAR